MLGRIVCGLYGRQALVQGSDTWDKKTTFAKQKWATKKLAKYVLFCRSTH
jgi:hypothetical protein